MHVFEQHIQSTIDRLGLLRRSSPVLVGLSGGADSVALLAVLTRLGYDCIAAHCNYHLRGDESVRDMRHAEAVAGQFGVNIYVRDFDVAERIAHTGESVEMACRELRYEWFNSLLDRDYSQAVAVAHHREDNVETFFINLLRSTGLAGLTGMDYRRDFVVRPLLDVSRRQIEEYLADLGVGFVTDSTNRLNDFRRNRLRNIVLPALEANFPGATEAILATMSHLSDSLVLYRDAVSSAAETIGATSTTVNVSALLSAKGEKRAAIVLFELLKPLGFNASQVSDIIKSAIAGHSGRRYDSPLKTAELDRGVLTLSNPAGNRSRDDVYRVSLKHDILVPVNISVTPHDITEFKPVRDPGTAYLDMAALEGEAVFEIRLPRTGDRLRPYGMKGEKLVSDLMKDAKFSAAQKRGVWVLTRNEEILWVIGLRASRHFSITPRTRRYLRLQLI